jgi:hypothetical protein
VEIVDTSMLAFPKPKDKKKVKNDTKCIKKRAKVEKERYSIFTSDLKHCIECGRTGVNLHEIFYGTGKRQLSIKYGTVIPLCNSLHHNQVESKGIHFDRILCDKWHKKGQLKYMEYYNKTEEEFREVFGRSYL